MALFPRKAAPPDESAHRRGPYAGPTQAERRRIVSFLGAGDQRRKGGHPRRNYTATRRARHWLVAVCLALLLLGMWGILTELLPV